MIVRIWSAQSTAAKAPAYIEHVKTQVFPALRKVDGFGGAMLLSRAAPDAVEVIVLTFWRSLDSIHGFAGADLEGAIVTQEAAALALIMAGYLAWMRHERAVREAALVLEALNDSHSWQARLCPPCAYGRLSAVLSD
jgi:heme-degrading monooxygenase HmoA